MPKLDISNFNLACAILGGFTTLFGLVSYVVKHKIYLSEAIVAFAVGVALGPIGAKWIIPQDLAGKKSNLDSINLDLTRLVLGVQLFITGVQLPQRYLKTEWKSLAILLGPNMIAMWLITSLIIWIMLPAVPVLFTLAIGACVTPTDPVLSSTIVKGDFAEKNISKDLRHVIEGESGANDGLGYLFLFLPLLLIEHTGTFAGHHQGIRTALKTFVLETILYQVLFSFIIGIILGWLSMRVVRFCHDKRWVDHQTFPVLSVAIAVCIIGVCGLIGSDDIFACFIAGNVFTWDDWYRAEIEDDDLELSPFQESIDTLLNIGVFIWLGAICPWKLIADSSLLTPWRIIGVCVLVLLLRRLPSVWLLHGFIWQMKAHQQALFVGFFGPIGVSAMFYLHKTLEYLETSKMAEQIGKDEVARLGQHMTVVVWVLVIASLFVHGLAISFSTIVIGLHRRHLKPLTTNEHSAEGAERRRDSDDERTALLA